MPDFTVQHVAKIDYALLNSLGIKHLMFDLDQTLRRPYSRSIDTPIIELFNDIRKTGFFETTSLVSNNILSLDKFGEEIGTRIFQPFKRGLRIVRKPNPLYFEEVLSEINASPETVVIIGDRLKTDILGGNQAGVYTIYVKKLGPIDYWFDWILFTRLRERLSLKKALVATRQTGGKSL